MSTPKTYGWCPGALRPMMSGDGLVVRVRAGLGYLTKVQSRSIANISRKAGNGLIDITSRANLQIRGIKPERHMEVLEYLDSVCLIDRHVFHERTRNIVFQPFWEEGDLTYQTADALYSALLGPDTPDLPGKFGFAIDTGRHSLLRGTSADIRFERAGSAIVVRADGAVTGASVATPEEAAKVAIELARWFLGSGGAPNGRGRMARHICSGAKMPSRFLSQEMPSAAISVPIPGTTPLGSLVALEFGQITHKVMMELSRLSQIRLTPWRMLLLEGIKSAPDLPGLIHDANDPRLRIDVCTGAPGCLQGKSATRDLARDLAPHLSQGQRLHISGCAKGCAHPRPAALTLTATAENTFDLIRNGRAGDSPAETGLSPDDIKKALQNAP